MRESEGNTRSHAAVVLAFCALGLGVLLFFLVSAVELHHDTQYRQGAGELANDLFRLADEGDYRSAQRRLDNTVPELNLEYDKRRATSTLKWIITAVCGVAFIVLLGVAVCSSQPSRGEKGSDDQM